VMVRIDGRGADVALRLLCDEWTLPIRFLPIPATFSVLPFPGIEPR
jgi:hypothetical protein